MMLVVTATSRYLIEPPTPGRPGRLTRTPGAGIPPSDDPEGWRTADMRRDGESVELLEMDNIEVGRPAGFLVRLYPEDQPALVTFRQTTPVADVEHLA